MLGVTHVIVNQIITQDGTISFCCGIIFFVGGTIVIVRATEKIVLAT